ncbi:hypothetical protein MPG40_00845 [Helicobacter pylori]|nr:hypothetical protein [Helicobacter pylori]UOR68576.1 hypothetical protein MPG40_00845 [Helicobacter pylori]
MEANKIEHDIFDKLVANKLITSFILNPNDEQNFKNHLFIDLVSSKPELTINNFKRTIFIIIGCGGKNKKYCCSIQANQKGAKHENL